MQLVASQQEAVGRLASIPSIRCQVQEFAEYDVSYWPVVSGFLGDLHEVCVVNTYYMCNKCL